MSSRTDEQQIHDLVGVIYAALLTEADWQDFLDRLNQTIPGAFSTLFFHDFRANAGAVAFASGCEGREGALQDYESYYSNLNPWMRRVAATPLGRGVIGEEIIPREEFNRSEYYADFIRKNGLETGVGLTLFKDKNCYFLLSMLTDETDVDRNLRRADILTRIAPHLQRVFNYYRSGEFHRAAVDFGCGIEMATGLSFILVNEDLRVVKASVEGENALSSGKVLGLDVTGRVRFRNPVTQSALRSLLRRRLVDAGTRIYEDPASQGRLIRIGGSPAVEFFAGPMVAVLIGRGSPSDPARLAARYGLSPAETRVFIGLAEGLGVAEIAERSKVTSETVRSQLKSIFRRTGTSSQVELIRLIVGTGPIV